jgi:chromate transport protein ChrA
MSQFDRALGALTRGLGPVALGLVAATRYVLIRELPGPWRGWAIAAATLGALTLMRVPPVVPILIAGVIGALVSW